MAEQAHQGELGNGLPRCLGGLEELQRPLYLSGGPRKKLLKGAYVRSRLDSDLHKASDEDILLAFYGNAKNRRELWRHWREQPAAKPGAARKTTGQAPRDTPPSLEYCILDGPYRKLLRSESSDEVILDRLRAEVESRLETWSAADDEERRMTILLTFSLASLTNDRSVLLDAVGKAAELEAEFGDLLAAPITTSDPDGDPAPVPTDGKVAAKATATAPEPALERGIRQAQSMFERAFDSVGDLLDSVDEVEALSIVGGFATGLQDRLRTLRTEVASKKLEIENKAAIDSLLAAADRLRDDIARHAASEAIRDDLDRLRDDWHSLPDVAPEQAGAEFDRLERDIPTAFEALVENHTRHRELEEQREGLRARKPTSRDEQRQLDHRLDECRKQATAARDRHRSAEDALLRLLAPAIAANGKTPATEASVEPNVPAAVESPADDTAAAVGLNREARPADRDATVRGTGADDLPGAESEPDSNDRPKPAQPGPAAPSAATGDEQPPGDSACAGPAAKPVEPPGPGAGAATDLDVEDTLPEEVGAREEEEEEESTPKWNEQERRVREAVAAALVDEPPRLAHAYQVCRTAEAAGIEAGLPRAALLEAALYSVHLEKAHGELEPDLRDAIQRAVEGAPDEREVSPETENAEALIGFAAALAPALLAPYTGAAALLQHLTHEGLPELYDFCQRAAQRSWAVQNAQVDAGASLRRAKRHTKREDALAKVQEELRLWRNESAKMPLYYTPANRIWEALLSDRGELGQLVLAVLAEAAPSRVREHLADLEDHDGLREIVERTGKGLLKANQSVATKTFKRFQRRLARPLELAHEYLDLAVESGPTDHRRLVINEFVSLLRDELPRLRDALRPVGTFPEQPLLVRAAARTAQQAAARVQDLVDPSHEEEFLTEPPAEMLKATGLFRLPDVRITEDGEGEGEPASLLEALTSSRPTDLGTAFERHLGSGDFESARRVLNWAERWADAGEQIDDAEAERWRDHLESSREDSLHALRDQAADSRAALEQAFRQGQIEPDRRAALDGRLIAVEEELEQGSVRQFEQQREIRRGRVDLNEAIDDSLKALQCKAAKLIPDQDDPRRQRIWQHMDDGDLVAANELLHRSGEETRAPAMAEEPEPLLLNRYLAINREALRRSAHDGSGVVEAARKGRRHGDLRFDRLDDDDRESAADLLESWRTLKRSMPGNRQKVARAAIGLLTRLGFLDARLHLEPATPETLTQPKWPDAVQRNFRSGELITAPLSNRGDCPDPHFGSQAGGRYRLLVFFEPPTAAQVLQRLQSEVGGQAPIVVCLAPLSDTTREQLLRKSFEQSLSFITLDEILLLFLAAQPPSRLASLFALALPFSYCQPFVRRGGSVPPEMFFGREREEREITNFQGSCFLYGGRQLGKTALLHRVEEVYSAPAQGRFAAVIDLKAAGIGDADTADIWGAIWAALRELHAIDDGVKRPSLSSRSIEVFMDALHERFNRDTGHTLLLMFDEADGFLRRDALNSSRETFAESSRLKSLMDRSRSIKVVFAGLHNVVRTTTQSNHPLAHLGEPICIGPFIGPEDRRQAELLLRLPLQACGYLFDPPRLVLGVLARANYYPSLLQIYGASLVNELSRTAVPRTAAQLPNIHRDVVEGVHLSRDLQELIRQRFEWTLQLDSRYEAIAYATAWMCRDDSRVLHDGADDERISGDVGQWWPAGFKDVDRGRFLALLEELVELGVLRRLSDRKRRDRYTLRTPNVLALLGDQEEIVRKLEALEGRAAEPDLGPHEIRRRHGDRGPLSRPLTLWQERRIAGHANRRSRRNAVVLVLGPGAAGVAQVRDFLTQGQSLVDVKPLAASRSTLGFERDLKRRIKARSDETTLFVAPVGTAKGARWKAAWIEAAIEALGRLRSPNRFARVVFTLDARRLTDHHETIEEWEKQGVVEMVRLRPWSIDFAAQCLDDDPDVGQMLDARQERDLAELCGGWPELLDLVLDGLRGGADPTRLRSRDGFAMLLKENADRLRSAFCLDQQALSEMLRLANEYGRAEQHELLGPEARELAGCTLSEDDVQVAFRVARKLSLLQEVGGARWQVDPTVARVMQETSD